MFLCMFLLCCFLQSISHYNFVNGNNKRDTYPRFIVEDGVKPAIFGSYSYDPIKQIFISPHNISITGPTPMTESTIPHSTAVGDETKTTQHTTEPHNPDDMLRKIKASSSKKPGWWLRQKPQKQISNVLPTTNKHDRVSNTPK